MSIEEYVQEELWDEKYWDTMESLANIAADIQNMRENPTALLNSLGDSNNSIKISTSEGHRVSEEV